MKRRGFLGLLAGGAVAGPSMVKSAAAQTMADLSLDKMGVLGGAINQGPSTMPSAGSTNWAVKALADLVGRTAAEHARQRRRMNIFGLDPDIAAHRSVSLATKVRWQRLRSYADNLENERGWLEREIAGYEP